MARPQEASGCSLLEALDSDTLQSILARVDARSLANVSCASRCLRQQANTSGLWQSLSSARWARPNELLFARQPAERCSDPTTSTDPPATQTINVDFKRLYGAANGWHTATASLHACRPTHLDDSQALALKVLPSAGQLLSNTSGPAVSCEEALIAGSTLTSVGVWSLSQAGTPQQILSTTASKVNGDNAVLAFELLDNASIAAGDDHGQIHILQADSQAAAADSSMASLDHIRILSQAMFW